MVLRKGLISYRDGGRQWRSFGARYVNAASTSAVIPGARTAEWRCALVAVHPTSPLYYRVSL
jgi:hypothetical protein